jgi:hypothetical protein
MVDRRFRTDLAPLGPATPSSAWIVQTRKRSSHLWTYRGQFCPKILERSAKGASFCAFSMS